MRNIVETALGLEDEKTRDRIKCAFSLDEVCTVDCAACNILNKQRTDLLNIAQCRRGGNESVFSIGFMKDK